MADVAGGAQNGLIDSFASGDLGGNSGGVRTGVLNTFASGGLGSHVGSVLFNTSPPLTVYFKMRGQDVDCGPLTYRTWVVTVTPDYTATRYTGPRCGATPFSNVVVTDTWEA